MRYRSRWCAPRKRIRRTSPIDLLAGLRERPDFTLLEFDCDHMVPLARPVETAAVIRKQLERG